MRSTGTGTTAHTCGNKYHICTLQGFQNLVTGFFGSFFADFRVCTCTQTFSQLFADLDAFFCLGKHQALLIAVHCNKFYAAYAGVDHTVYGVIAATAYTNYFNIGQRFKGCLYVIKHILRPP